MLINLLRLIFIICALVFIFMLVRAWWHKRQQGSWSRPLLAGGGHRFCRQFSRYPGVGSFAVKTACYKQFKLIDDRLLPGTLNGQCVLPTVTQSLIFIGAVQVDPLTLIGMMVAAAAGAAWGRATSPRSIARPSGW